MTPVELHRRAVALGLRLEPRGDKLAVIPANRLPPDFADELRQHKAELLQWLSHPAFPGWQALPPDDLHLATIMPDPTPQNRERVIAYLLRQTQGCVCPLAAWLVRRENLYFAGPGAEWDCGLICYAGARDAACWQLKRSEQDVWVFLEAADEAASGGCDSPKDR